MKWKKIDNLIMTSTTSVVSSIMSFKIESRFNLGAPVEWKSIKGSHGRRERSRDANASSVTTEQL